MANQKPKSPAQIAKLGDALDRAERRKNQLVDTAEFCGPLADDIPPDEVAAIIADDEAIRTQYRAAHWAYAEAVTERVHHQMRRLENSKCVPKSGDRIPLEAARWTAEDRVELIDAMYPQFASAREFIDANAAFMIAEHAYEVARDKFQEAAREDVADKRAGIVRRRGNAHIIRL